ncbi:MAG: ABC transporter substrate-binding protein [Candidatus Nezhaarchaeales archaeon]
MKPSRVVSVITGVMLISLLALVLFITLPTFKTKVESISMAVEFNTHSAAAWVALDKGIFMEEGLNVTSLQTFVTGVELAAALTKGDVEVAWACLGPLVSAYSIGVPIVVVAQAHLHGYALVVKSDIEDVHQLNGKVIAHPGVGSPNYLLIRMLMDEYKLNVTLKPMKPPAIVNALVTGQIDAAALPEHYATLAVRRGECKILLRSQDVWPEMPGSFLVVKKDFLEKDPEKAARLVKATVKATEFIRNHFEESARIVADKLDISFKEALDSMRWLDYRNEIDVNQVTRYIDLMVKYGVIEKPVNVSDFINTTILSSVLGR